MSAEGGSLNGASFELRLLREQFVTDLSGAVEDARRASEAIKNQLGSVTVPGFLTAGGYDAYRGTLQAVERQLDDTRASVLSLTTAVDSADSAIVGTIAGLGAWRDALLEVGEAARLAATPIDQLQAQAATLARNSTSAGAGTGAGTGQGGSAGQPSAAAVAGPAQANLAGIATAAQAVTTNTQRATVATKELLAAQSALNATVGALVREDVTTGRGAAEETAERTREAIEALRADEPALALLSIREAGVAASRGIDELNASIQRLTSGDSRLKQAQDDYSKLIDEIDRLDALGTPASDPTLRALVAQSARGQAAGNAGDDDAPARALAAQNAQARALTATIRSLAAAEKELTSEERQAAEEAAKRLAADQRAAEKLAQTQAEALAAQQAANLRAGQTQAQVGADQFNATRRAEMVQTLETTGATAKEASDAVRGLENAIGRLNTAQVTKNLPEGVYEIGEAADYARIAVGEIAGGDVFNGLRAEEEAIRSLRDALVILGAAADRVKGEIVGDATDAQAALAKLIEQQRRTIQGSIDALNLSRQNLNAPLARAAEAAQVQADQQAASRQASGVASFVAADPVLQSTTRAKEALQQEGLLAKEAEKAVNQLQRALGQIGAAANIKDVQVGLTGVQEASDHATKALELFAARDRLGGIQAERDAILALEKALVEVRVAAKEAQDALPSGQKSPELTALLQRGSSISGAIGSVETSVNSARSRELEAETKARNDAANAAERAAKAVEAEGRAQKATANTIFSAAQDLGYAANFGQAGQLIAGIGRASQLAVGPLQELGLSLGAATAAAAGLIAAAVAVVAALGAVLVTGLKFNSQLELMQVRFKAATGSAADARKEIDALLNASASKEFGFFPVADLEQGITLLERTGNATDDMKRRVADAAAATGKSYQDAATQIEALYTAIRSNQPFGEQTRALERSGIITSQWANALRAAEAAGLSTEEKVKILNAALDEFNGTAKDAGTTTVGAFQRIKNELGVISGLATKDFLGPFSHSLSAAADVFANPAAQEALTFWITKFIQFNTLIPSITAGLADLVHKTTGIGLPGGKQADSPDRKTAKPSDYLSPEQDNANATQLYESGRKAVDAYVRGFDDEARGEFGKLQDIVRSGIEAAAGGNVTEPMERLIAGSVSPAVAKLVAEIQSTGKYTQETADVIRGALGDQADRVLELATTYGKLRQAVEAVAAAQKALDQAQRNLSVTQDTRTAILAIDQAEIDKAEAAAATHRQEADDQIQRIRDDIEIVKGTATFLDNFYQAAGDLIRDKIKTAQRANSDAAEAARADIDKATKANEASAEDARVAIQGAQDSLKDYQTSVEDRRRGADAEIQGVRDHLDAINKAIADSQAAASQHQAAYNAVINGTIDLFNQVETQQDDITRKIIAKWDAELSGLRRARDEANNRVDQDELRQAEIRLSYDKRVQAARDAGHVAEAAALEKERDRVLQRETQNGQVNRDEAALADKRSAAAEADARREAAQQGATDQVGTNKLTDAQKATQAQLDGLEAAEKIKRQAEDDEVKRRQAEIDHLTRVEADRNRIATADIKAKQDAEALRKLNADHELLGMQDTLDGIELAKKKAAEAATARTGQLNGEITLIEAAQRAQEAADISRIAGLKAIYLADKTYWDQRVIADQAAVDAATNVLTAAQQTKKQYDDQVASLGEIFKQVDAILLKEQQRLDVNRQLAGLNPIPRGPNGEPLSQGDTGGKPLNQGPTDGPGGAPGGGGGTSTPVNPNAAYGTPGGPTLPLLPGDQQVPSPPGYHKEWDDTAFLWEVPDKWHLENYGRKQGAAPKGAEPAAPPAATTPAPGATPGDATPSGGGGSSYNKVPLAPVLAADYRAASGFGSGGMDFALARLPLVPPDYPSVVFDAGAHARAVASTPGPRRGEGAGGLRLSVAGNLVHIERVDASDPADVQAMIAQVEARIWGGADLALEMSRRGGVWQGRRGGNG